MADTYCPTCGEPWDLDERKIVKQMKMTHRCPSCPKDMITDKNIEQKMYKMLFDDDCDDGDPMEWF